ncbi:HNH endonuclease [Serinibacter salmoneus]|uniref:HNH endonuclease n=1 Tax=Serinibacter salmoneus TaxID=556530 RepID=UPI003CCBD91F
MHLAYGWAVVAQIETSEGVKAGWACPFCGSESKWKARKSRALKYRCSKCGNEFPELVRRDSRIQKFSAIYAETWLEFVAPAPVGDLQVAYVHGDVRNAIRRLDASRARSFIARHQGLDGGLAVEVGDEWVHSGGFAEARAKVRRMQGAFRRKLLDRYGEVCAVTGSHPADVLDAAHLYSYAETPVHRERGGLLLRKDVHASLMALRTSGGE